jgi:catechol 2,3-dioxygenase-like lactoylglutathione lyase family enzyme
MIDHLSIGASDLARSVAFYRKTFLPLGFALQHETAAEASFGPGTDRTFWLYTAREARALEGMHIAFAAPSTTAVDQAYAAARDLGAISVREPDWRPEISDQYYGSVVLDPDGHKLEILVYASMEQGISSTDAPVVHS